MNRDRTHYWMIGALGLILALLLMIAHAVILAEYAEAYDCDGEDCGEEEIVVPDYVARSLDKAIVTRRDGSQDTLHLAPGSGTSYLYPDSDGDLDETDEDDAEETLTW